MFITRKTKGKRRKGFVSVQSILIGMVLLAITAATIAPRFLNVGLPAYKSNIKEELGNIDNIVSQWVNDHDGKTDGLTWNAVKTAGMVNDSFSEQIIIDDTADITKQYYMPRWGKGDVKIYLTGNDDKDTANVYIEIVPANSDIKTGFLAPLEKAVDDSVSLKYGSSVVKGDATGIDTTAITSRVEPDDDGKIEFTIR